MKHLSYQQNKYQDIQKFASSVALKAGSILCQYFERNKKSFNKLKGSFDFATEADLEVDKFIKKELKKGYPDFDILTEETAPGDYYKFIESDNLWVVDPIDGSTNFSKKRPHFGISIALVDKGIPRAGVVYLPIQKELYTVTENTKSLLNGQELNVSKINSLETAWIESGLSWDMKKREEFTRWFSILSKKVRAFTMSGSAVFDMSAVAKGQVDAFVYCGIKPWDQAAAGLLIQRAGGTITTAKGKPWNVFEKDIIGSNGLIHNLLLSVLKPG